jgi:lysophospholipase L1-like esterase
MKPFILFGTMSSSPPPVIDSVEVTSDAPMTNVPVTASVSATGYTSLAYQWKRDGSAIGGATSATYSPVDVDVGTSLSVTATATGAGGSVSSTRTCTAPVLSVTHTDLKTWVSDANWIYPLNAGSQALVTGVPVFIVGGTGWTTGLRLANGFFAGFGTPDGTRNMLQSTAGWGGSGLTGGVGFQIGQGTLTAQIVCDGNSLTAGNVPQANYPNNCAGNLGANWKVTNYGVGGQITTAMTADAVAQVDPNYNAAYTHNILCAWEITNDLFFGATAATAIANFKTYCAARKSAGWKVCVLTVTPRSEAGTPGSFEASRQTCNTELRNPANLGTYWDIVADVAADSRIGDAGDELDTTYYMADKVHLNATGYALVGQLVAQAIIANINP